MKSGWILIVGSLQHGIQAVGPFPHDLAAHQWADSQENEALIQDPVLDTIYLNDPAEMEKEYLQSIGELSPDDELGEDEDED